MVDGLYSLRLTKPFPEEAGKTDPARTAKTKKDSNKALAPNLRSMEAAPFNDLASIFRPSEDFMAREWPSVLAAPFPQPGEKDTELKEGQ
jgi:hypothetical protein